MSVFDGLANIFVATFGEPVIFTPVATGVPVPIRAIWIETPINAPFADADSDAVLSRLHVQESVVAAFAEGDTAERVKSGKRCKLVPPFGRDDKGMNVAALELIPPP